MNIQIKSNSIFRRQPNYSFFNKSLDKTNPFFLKLNEIDDYFLHSVRCDSKLFSKTPFLTDPRTRKKVTKICCDHRKAVDTLHKCGIPSKLNIYQHIWGIKLIQTLQHGLDVDDADLLKWESLVHVRNLERHEFLKYAIEHFERNREQILAPGLKLVILYKKWYFRRMNYIKNKYSLQFYNTYMGLPHIRICKPLTGPQEAEIHNPLELRGKGFAFIEKEQLFTWVKISQHNLELYVDEYANCEIIRDQFCMALISDMLKDVCNQKTQLTIPKFFIPIESLLFLLTTGDYIDMCTELFIEIKELPTNNGLKKLIKMEEPLPSRLCGRHTNQKIFEQAVLASLSIADNIDWCNVENGFCINKKDNLEVNGTSNTVIHKYKLENYDQYLQSHHIPKPQRCKFCQMLIKWNLKSKGNENTVDNVSDLQIYTIADSLNSVLTANSENMNGISIKLEYNVEFGCEVMTKYELLKEWLLLKLLKNEKRFCIRMDVRDYSILAVEHLSLKKLENSLVQLYQVNLPHLLCKLKEFLQLLLSVPKGHYMIRYDSKFKDNLLLCKPSSEITPNTVNLHIFFQTEPKESLLIFEKFVPIADNICSIIHLENHVLPCAFRPISKLASRRRNKEIQKPFNDRECILNRVLNKKNELTKAKKAARRKIKRRIRRQRKLLIKKNDPTAEKKELEEEINNDMKYFGF